MNVYFVTLGCPKNLVDSEYVMAGLGKSVKFVKTPSEADAIIINTCAFINSAREESIETILEAVALKNQGNHRQLFVIGCLPQRYQKELETEFPEVDGFWGNRNLYMTTRQLAEKLNLEPQPGERRIHTTPPHYAYLKIAEGCNNRCSYCTIPLIRGDYRSRTLDSILKEAEVLVNNGVRELILIAQDTTQYGWDLNGNITLVSLLDRLSQITSVKWIRLLYTHPAHFSDDLITLIAERENICKYLDLPLQHISDRILTAMGRRVTHYDIEHLIERLRQRIPKLALRTTLMVGFPGETDADFEELKEFVERTRFERLGVFAYSHEQGTPAYYFADQVAEEVKQERMAELMELQAQISNENNQTLMGAQLEVVVDEYDLQDKCFVGRTQWDSPEIDNRVLLDCEVQVGEFYQVKIVRAYDYELKGQVLSYKSSDTTNYEKTVGVNSSVITNFNERGKLYFKQES